MACLDIGPSVVVAVLTNACIASAKLEQNQPESIAMIAYLGRTRPGGMDDTGNFNLGACLCGYLFPGSRASSILKTNSPR
jgi:hypothetical protein